MGQYTAEEVSQHSKSLAARISATYEHLFDEQSAMRDVDKNDVEEFRLPGWKDFNPKDTVEHMVRNAVEYSVQKNQLHSELSFQALKDFQQEHKGILHKHNLANFFDLDMLFRHPNYYMSGSQSDAIYIPIEARAYSMLIAVLAQYEQLDKTFIRVSRVIHKSFPNVASAPSALQTRLDRAVQKIILCSFRDAFDQFSPDVPIEWGIPVIRSDAMERFQDMPLLDTLRLFPGTEHYHIMQ